MNCYLLCINMYTRNKVSIEKKFQICANFKNTSILTHKCELPKVIIRHNIGPISAAISRLLLLGQCHDLQWSSAGPRMAAFFDRLNWRTFSRNLAQYRPYTKPIVTFTMAPSSESRRARVWSELAAKCIPELSFLQGHDIGKRSSANSWRCWSSVGPYLTSLLGGYNILVLLHFFTSLKWNATSDLGSRWEIKNACTGKLVPGRGLAQYWHSTDPVLRPSVG